MIDRINPPTFGKQWEPELLAYQLVVLHNGMKAYLLPSETTDGAVKMDLVLGAGTSAHAQKGVASAVCHLFTEGVPGMSSASIHEAFDFYGSYLERECSADDARISLYGLRKFLPEMLGLLSKVLNEACFPEAELELYKSRQKQKLSVNQQKNAFLAKRYFSEQVWGKSHPYGRSMTPEDYSRLEKPDLLSFFSNAYQPGNAYLILSGSVSEYDVALLNAHFGSLFLQKTDATNTTETLSWENSPIPGLQKLLKPDSVQTAIRVGGQTIGRQHPDFMGLQVLNTLLGGYFGSRLMRSIREEKGLTYGISSAISTLKNGAVWGVQTEVAVEKWGEALQEIRLQVVTLQQNDVNSDELTLVKNFMLGSFGRMFDGVFARAERLKTLIDHNLPADYYVTYANAISTITPADLTRLAHQYFDPDAFTEVVV